MYSFAPQSTLNEYLVHTLAIIWSTLSLFLYLIPKSSTTRVKEMPRVSWRNSPSVWGVFFVSKLLQVCDEIVIGKFPNCLDLCIDIAVSDKWLQFVVGNHVRWDEVDGKMDVLCIVKCRAQILFEMSPMQ